MDSLGLVLPPLAEAANHAGDAAAGEQGATSTRMMNAAALSALSGIRKDFDTTRAPDGPVTRKQVSSHPSSSSHIRCHALCIPRLASMDFIFLLIEPLVFGSRVTTGMLGIYHRCG